MAASTELLRVVFPTIDEEISSYITGILEENADDFQSSDDVYEALGEVLLEVAGDNRDEKDIRTLCQKLLATVKCSEDDDDSNSVSVGLRKLDTLIDLKDKAKQLEEDRFDTEAGGIWCIPKNGVGGSKVDSRKLEKAEARLKDKQTKRSNVPEKPNNSVVADEASVSQAVSKKESRQEAKGTNNAKDIRIENFDVSYKDRVLIKNTDVTLAFGRRYGLVGRNGLGKTTLLRAISGGQLRIPSHITILHVEQEVVGDETPALESVLQCDETRERLLKEEAELNAKISAKSGDEQALTARLAEVYANLQLIEADKAPSRASIILAGLGFSPEMQQKHTREFSGGWRMRLALARALFSKPDLLLLDEPTNMLDIKAIIWLETYLQAWESTLLVVSHDRHFLDVVPTDIIFLRDQRLDPYRGNYENFIKAKTEKLKNQMREYEAQQAYRAHVQVFIDKFRYNAKRASLVQSKIKLLEKLPEIQPIEKETEVIFRFPDPEKLSPPILQLDEVGENGAGKSTLLKILTGALSPVKGIYHAHRNLRIGYFSQHHVDQLDMSVSSVELLATRFPGHPVEKYRQQLGRFGISGDLALQVVATLSGGQKSRVAFSALTFSTPNFLVLDEPTNHLDVETIEALGKALRTFQGGVVLVSHDEMLIRMVCQELWVCASGSVRSIEGGFDEYREIVKQELKAQMQRK